MSGEQDDFEDLQQLFDRTAEQASGPTLTKLRARAADVPERAPRATWRRWLVPTFAFAGGALVAALALRSGEPAIEPLAHVPVPALLSVPSASAAAELEAPLPAADPSLDPELEGLDHLAGDLDSDDQWAGLLIPAEETELELWLAGAEYYLAGGG